MTLFCANNMKSNIQHRMTSHYPYCVWGATAKRAFRAPGVGNWDELHHRRTQDFTMEQVHVVGALQRVWGQVPLWGAGAKPR